MKKKRVLTLLALLLAMMFAITAFASLAGYWIDAYGVRHYTDDSYHPYGGYNAYNTYYPYSYNYYYYGDATTGRYDTLAEEYLGGLVSPRATLVEAKINNKQLGLSMAGMTEELSKSYAPAFANTATRLTFRQNLGRAEDGSLCVLLAVVGTNTTDANQYAIGLVGKLAGLETALKEGAESIAFIDRSNNVRATMDLADLIEGAKLGFEENGGSDKTDKLYIQVRPESTPNELAGKRLNSKTYSVNAYLCKDMQTVDISKHFGNVHLAVKTDSSNMSVIVGTSEQDSSQNATTPKWSTQTNGATFASGYLPMGSKFAAAVK